VKQIALLFLRPLCLLGQARTGDGDQGQQVANSKERLLISGLGIDRLAHLIDQP
jgi:hypothetical protein